MTVSIAFLTIADISGFISDDELVADLLRRRGWRVDFLPWDQTADWNEYDQVIIRTTWDYQDRPGHFLNVLAAIEESQAALYNSLSIVRWNMDKHYLADLARWDVPIVPTTFARRLSNLDQLLDHYHEFEADDLIIKPQIGANAFDTFHIRRDEIESALPALTAVFKQKPYMAQPFMPQIRTEGEYSLIYCGSRFSHAILKTPSPGDFRVQEEHGGIITAVDPEKALLAVGDRAISVLNKDLDEAPLYARVDMVRDRGADFRIMELELIEPSLYLRMHPTAPARFAAAITAVL